MDENNQLSYEQNINIEYRNNGITNNLVNEINNFTTITIEDYMQDRFWSDLARNFFGLLIISNLVNGNEIKTKELLYQIADINNMRNIIQNNISKISNNPLLQVFTKNVELLNSDKTFKSVLELIENGLIKYYAENTQDEIEDDENDI